MSARMPERLAEARTPPRKERRPQIILLNQHWDCSFVFVFRFQTAPPSAQKLLDVAGMDQALAPRSDDLGLWAGHRWRLAAGCDFDSCSLAAASGIVRI